MKKILFFLLISNLLWSQWSISNAERAALITLNQTTNGEKWNRTWDLNNDPRTWFGIKIRNGNVIEINLSGNALDGNFPSNLAVFSGLEKIDLSNNKLIGEVAPSLTALFSLKKLDISHNNLSGDPTTTLSSLSQLEELRIGYNKLEIANASNLLQNLSELKDLDLSNLQLTEVPSKLTSLNDIKHLNLSNNKITNGFDRLAGLQSLEMLSLANNQLTKIPSEIINLNLLNLDLSDNPITNFSNIDLLTKLQWLSLENCQLIQVPTEIKQLKQLQSLNLGRNKIGVGFANLLTLTSLQQLFINNNELKDDFPTEVLSLPQLMMLSVANNELEGNLPNQLPPICDISNNKYNKDQIYNYLNVNNSAVQLSYSPQRYDNPTEVKGVLGQDVTLTQSLSGTEYAFSWFKNLGENMSVNTPNLFISDIEETDYSLYTAEAYHLKKYNHFILDLSLFREPITLSKGLSTEDNNLNYIKIYPNPTSDVLNIISSNNNTIEGVFIYDLSGKQVLTSKQNNINVSNLPSGVYMLNIKTDKGYKNFKFIKK